MPAPDFEVEVTALVNTYLTPAAGYSATDQDKMITFLVDDIVPLVIPGEIVADYTDPIYTAIQAEALYNFGKAIEPFKTMLYFLCSQTINNIVLPYYYSGGGAVELKMFSYITQNGVLPPTYDDPPFPNPFGEIPPWTYDGVGEYGQHWGVTTPFLNASRVKVEFGTNSGPNTHFYAVVMAPNELAILTDVVSVDPGTDDLIGTPTNALLLSIWQEITVFQ